MAHSGPEMEWRRYGDTLGASGAFVNHSAWADSCILTATSGRQLRNMVAMLARRQAGMGWKTGSLEYLVFGQTGAVGAHTLNCDLTDGSCRDCEVENLVRPKRVPVELPPKNGDPDLWRAVGARCS